MNFANNEMMVITALLCQQFDLELVTKEPGIERGLGANRPAQTIVRYRRKPQSDLVSLATEDAIAAAGCPHAASMMAQSS